MKNKTLSDEIREIPDDKGIWDGDEAILIEKIKQFIKRLKEEIRNDMTTHPNKHIDRLAGKELVK